ncbi:HhH-GPD family protein [Capillimicrobium parvum]|nr:A/G-specific adenine glycosylase [Capillimicrobium parvum]
MDELLEWYDRVRRDLPWRRTTDPYAILVSEVMLQQTQVARVVPRYEAWLERWPTAEALAAAPLGDVLAEWIGLGYNRRAKALWEAAGIVAAGGWPEDLRTLPGVGPYTAAAVGSFAFGHEVLAIDTNARRVYERWGFRPRPSAGVNQAVMELGATLCRAHEARCAECPVSRCAARGRPVVRPARGRRERFEDTDRYARGRVLAAMVGREPWPDALERGRIERALEGLARDGLIRLDETEVSHKGLA